MKDALGKHPSESTGDPADRHHLRSRGGLHTTRWPSTPHSEATERGAAFFPGPRLPLGKSPIQMVCLTFAAFHVLPLTVLFPSQN